MRTSVTYPGRRSDDLRTTVTVEEPGTPWPLRFHFLHPYDDETEAYEYVNVGFEVGKRFPADPRREGPVAVEDADLEPLDFVALQRVAGKYAAYLELARQILVLDREGIAGAVKLLRGPGRKPARLTDDFYRLIASDYTSRRDAGEKNLVTAIAQAHHVTPGAASRWIKEARKRNYLPPKNRQKKARNDA